MMTHTRRQNKMLLLLILLLCTTLLSRIGLPFLLALVYDSSELTTFSQVFLGQIIAYVIPLILFFRVTKRDSAISFRKISVYKMHFSAKSIPILNVLPLVLFYFLIIVSGLNAIYLIVFSINPELILAQKPSAPPFQSFLVLCLIFGVMPAFIEEIMFRGIAFDAFHDTGIILFIVPTFLFAFSHDHVFSILSAGLLGLFLMKTMVYTRNLYVVIVIHFVYNIFSLIIANYIILPYSVVYLSGMAVSSVSITGIVLVYLSFMFFSILMFSLIWVRFRRPYEMIFINDQLIYSKIGIGDILLMIVLVGFTMFSFLVL